MISKKLQIFRAKAIGLIFLLFLPQIILLVFNISVQGVNGLILNGVYALILSLVVWFLHTSKCPSCELKFFHTSDRVFPKLTTKCQHCKFSLFAKGKIDS